MSRVEKEVAHFWKYPPKPTHWWRVGRSSSTTKRGGRFIHFIDDKNVRDSRPGEFLHAPTRCDDIDALESEMDGYFGLAAQLRPVCRMGRGEQEGLIPGYLYNYWCS